jgi:hypothetical protein
MARSLEALQRIGLKLFLDDDAALDPRTLVPVFHRWIQTRALDLQLIDVADYTHVHEGPSVVLVAHEGNLVLDLSDGRMGLQYYRKQTVEGPLSSRLASLCRLVVSTAIRLEADPVLKDRARFRGDELEFVSNDRLAAPNDEETFGAMSAALGPLAQRLYPDVPVSLSRNPDPRERLIVHVKAPQRVPLATLGECLIDS